MAGFHLDPVRIGEGITVVKQRPIVAVATAVCIGLAGCGTGRSTEAFCQTYQEQKQAYIAKYMKASGDVQTLGDQDALLGLLGGTAMIAQSLGDVIVIFDKLDKVAPDDIEPDVAAVRDSMKSQLDSASDMMSDPLGAIMGSLMQGLTSGGSWQRVSDYVQTNCEA